MMPKASKSPVDFLERDDLPGTYYSSLHLAMNAVVDDYPSGLTQNVTINCIKRVREERNPLDSNKPNNLRVWTAVIKDWNKDTVYTLTINGNFKYTLSCYSLGGIRIENCDNIIIKNMQFYDYSNYYRSSSPEEVAAIYSVGSMESKNKNIVVLRCTFDGVYKHTTGTNIYADYAFDTKLTSNIVIQRCTFNKAAGVPIKCSDVDCMEIKESYLSGNIKRSTIAHETLCSISNSIRIEITDCILNGLTLEEYGLTITDTKEFICKRNRIFNFDGTIFLLKGTEDLKSTFDSCLFFDNLKRHLLNYLKFLVRIEQPVTSLSVINNTVYMNGINVYFQEAFSVDGDVVSLTNYNNIYIDKNNRVNTFLRVTGLLTNYYAKSNLYKSLLYYSGDRFNTTTILSCDSFKEAHSITETRNLIGFQSAGYEQNSVISGSTENLLEIELLPSGSTLTGITSYETISNEYLADGTIYNNFDIDYKKVTGTTSTIGAFNLIGQVWNETGDTTSGYTGTDIVENETFNQLAVYTVSADDGIIIQSNTLDRNYLLKFIFSGGDYNILRYGNSVYLTLLCDFDANGLYIDDISYDVNIEKESL